MEFNGTFHIEEKRYLDVKLLEDSGYARSPKQSARYRWWKPIPIAFVTLILWLIFFGILMGVVAARTGMPLEELAEGATGGYDDSDFETVPGILINIGGLAMLIPALFLATKIFRLPFGYTTSVVGHMRWNVLFKCLLIALVFYGIVGFGTPPLMKFSDFSGLTAEVAMALLITVPLQCAAEEYIFRGFIIQTFGCWIPWAIVGVIVQALFFVSQHPYDMAGKFSVAVTAIVFAYLAIRTGGLEAGIAAHTMNNLIAFFAAATEVSEVTSDVDWESTLLGAAFEIAFAIFVVKFGGKRGWFDDKAKSSKNISESIDCN